MKINASNIYLRYIIIYERVTGNMVFPERKYGEILVIQFFREIKKNSKKYLLNYYFSITKSSTVKHFIRK